MTDKTHCPVDRPMMAGLLGVHPNKYNSESSRTIVVVVVVVVIVHVHVAETSAMCHL
jgi:hypothetical protein